MAGKVFIATPEGEELIIDGTRICRSSSPEECWEEHPEIVGVLIDVAYREGWPMRREPPTTVWEAYRQAGGREK